MSILSPTSFAKYYTVGTLFLIFRYVVNNDNKFISTFFLVGPSKQLRSMFHPSRIFAAAAYFGSMISTLYCALKVIITIRIY